MRLWLRKHTPGQETLLMIIENALRMMRMILNVFLTLSTLKHSEFHYILYYIVCFVHWDSNLLVVYSHREEDLKETGQSKGMFN